MKLPQNPPSLLFSATLSRTFHWANSPSRDDIFSDRYTPRARPPPRGPFIAVPTVPPNKKKGAGCPLSLRLQRVSESSGHPIYCSPCSGPLTAITVQGCADSIQSHGPSYRGLCHLHRTRSLVAWLPLYLRSCQRAVRRRRSDLGRERENVLYSHIFRG